MTPLTQEQRQLLEENPLARCIVRLLLAHPEGLTVDEIKTFLAQEPADAD